MSRFQVSDADDLTSIANLLQQLPNAGDGAQISQDVVRDACRILMTVADTAWQDGPPEIVGPQREDTLGLVLVRKRRQLAYTLKLSNLGRDPFATLPAPGFSAAGMSALPALAAAPPATFPSFLLAIGFAWLRAFAQPIGYGEAALLHYMNQISVINGIVTDEDLAQAGGVLVRSYGYVKGQNSNEITALVASLLAWDAIEHFNGGYRVKESVPFGLGPLEYVP